MTKTIWVVGGGAEAIPGIILAKKLGLNVVVSDGNPNAPGLKFADKSIIASTYDIESTVNAAYEYHQNVNPIDGVICIAADVPLTVASIAEKLSLPGITTETARKCSDKFLMKETLLAAGIPIPWFSLVKSVSELRSIISERGLPLVIKPVDSRGARGVIRITESLDLEWTFEYAKSFSPTSRVVVEEFLEGQQYSTESVITDEKNITLGFAERNYEFLEELSPYIIENGGQQPAKIDKKELDSIVKLVEKSSQILGISNATSKGDVVMTKEGPKIIEIAPRLSGGYFSSDQIPLATGINVIEIAIRLSLGEKINKDKLLFRHQNAVAIRYFFPKPGKIISISNIDSFKNKSWVHKLNLFFGVGDVLEKITDHPKRCGFVITTGNTRDEAVERAKTVVKNVQIFTRQ
jgi:biotin carboxylase